jgi:hypothetical protein
MARERSTCRRGGTGANKHQSRDEWRESTTRNDQDPDYVDTSAAWLGVPKALACSRGDGEAGTIAAAYTTNGFRRSIFSAAQATAGLTRLGLTPRAAITSSSAR